MLGVPAALLLLALPLGSTFCIRQEAGDSQGAPGGVGPASCPQALGGSQLPPPGWQMPPEQWLQPQVLSRGVESGPRTADAMHEIEGPSQL